MQLQILTGLNNGGGAVFTIRCPRCRSLGTFSSLGTDHYFSDQTGHVRYIGHRLCPNPTCRLHLFVVADQHSRLLTSYPHERIDFDSKNVPAVVVASFEEAITCRANECFIAAAIMVRKTLELLCGDQEAKGGDLKARIKALGAKAILPPELFAGLDDLRLLGNDAAHVESSVYGDISSLEVDVAIEFTKEVLKAIYQLADLLQRLKSLKKPSVAGSSAP